MMKTVSVIVTIVVVLVLILAGLMLFIGTQTNNPSAVIESETINKDNSTIVKVTVSSMNNANYIEITGGDTAIGGIDANNDGLKREISRVGGSLRVKVRNSDDNIIVYAVSDNKKKLVHRVDVS